MPRPTVPLPKDVVEIARGLKAEGIPSGVIRCADGTEIQWGDVQADAVKPTALEQWKAKKNAS